MYTLEKINEKLQAANDERKKWKNLKEALQAVCEHNWDYDGHGHNDDHYTC